MPAKSNAVHPAAKKVYSHNTLPDQPAPLQETAEICKSAAVSTWKQAAYTESLRRSLLEAQVERDFLKTANSIQQMKLDNTDNTSSLPYSAESMLSERMCTATTGISLTTTVSEPQQNGDREASITAEDFPEFRIETATDKMKVNLTDDLVVSLNPREDGKHGILAAWKDITQLRRDIFESRIADMCTWFDLSGNNLKFDLRDSTPDQAADGRSENLPDMWQSFKNLQELSFGESCSDDSTCKRGNLLRSIPPSVLSIGRSLKILSFSSNHLQSIPEEISRLVNLEQLKLDDNELREFQVELLHLPRLTLLDLDNNLLERVEADTLPGTLKCLRLKNNNIAHFSLAACKNSLQQVDLSCNNLTNLEQVAFKSLGHLRLLDLSSNILECIPKTFGKMERLRRLYLDDNMLTKLPSSVCLLQKLQVLNISQNKIAQLPPEVGNLTNLRELHVENNALEELPSELKNVPRLLSLCASGNKLVCIPPVISQLRYLRDILLFDNKIRHLDISILSCCHNLIVLGLGMNRIKTIPAAISKLKNIRIIQLDSNRLSSLPDELSHLGTLKYLSLNSNRIEFLPDSLADLGNLVGLLVDSNSLTEIPYSIGSLKSLRVLSAKDNYIESIPDSVSLLVNIELLDVCNNRLTRLPTTISEFNERVELKATNNQLELPPQEVADKGMISIKTYLDSTAQLQQCSSSNDLTSEHSEFETTAI